MWKNNDTFIRRVVQYNQVVYCTLTPFEGRMLDSEVVEVNKYGGVTDDHDTEG